MTLRQHRTLPQNPFNVASCEGLGFPLRAPARNGDADAPVELDAKQIPACTAMTHEVDRCDRAVERRCDGIDEGRRPPFRLAERKTQLHDDRIPDRTGLLTGPGRVVLFVSH